MAKIIGSSLAATLTIAVATYGCAPKSPSPTRQQCVRSALHLPNIKLSQPNQTEFSITATTNHKPFIPGQEPDFADERQTNYPYSTTTIVNVMGSFVRITRQDEYPNGSKHAPIRIIVTDGFSNSSEPSDNSLIIRLSRCGLTPQ